LLILVHVGESAKLRGLAKKACMNKNFFSTLLRPEWRRKASPGRAGTVVLLLSLPFISGRCEDPKPSYDPCFNAYPIITASFVDAVTGEPLVGPGFRFHFDSLRFGQSGIHIIDQVSTAGDGSSWIEPGKGRYIPIRWTGRSYVGYSQKGWPAPGTLPDGRWAFRLPGMTEWDTLTVNDLETGEPDCGYMMFYVNRKLFRRFPFDGRVHPDSVIIHVPVVID
jgi:hypothetical protein